jgi:hypothetical protein
MNMTRLIGLVAAETPATGVTWQVANAQADAAFFKGKTVTV